MEKKMAEEIRTLVERSKFVFVGSVDKARGPVIKAMFALDRDGLGGIICPPTAPPDGCSSFLLIRQRVSISVMNSIFRGFGWTEA